MRGAFDDDFSELFEVGLFIFLECDDVAKGPFRVVLEENAIAAGHYLETESVEEHFRYCLCEDGIDKDSNDEAELVDQTEQHYVPDAELYAVRERPVIVVG